ncbi:hypothetical protein P4603_26180 [Priestia aryabhattai]|uniref:hypothetical protein n=1 Tax=Priestia aryabhattai TaxID=412384 RepID=UPI002E1F8678|nr:hypothetical protein [Priestia aryabhattai]
MSQDEHFRKEVERLKDKYLCPDLEIIPCELTKEQLQKRRFDEADLHFKDYDFQDYKNGKLYIPSFYEDEIDLPTTGNKFIRSQVLFQKGDLVQVQAEIGHWKLRPFNTRHKEYVVEDRKNHQIEEGFAYWRREDGKPSRWAYLKEEDWKKRKAQLEEDLSNPVLREVELDFYYLLNEAAKSEASYDKLQTKQTFLTFLQNVNELDWYLANVLGLWAAFKLYPVSLYESLLERIDELHDELVPAAFDFCESYDGEVLHSKKHPELEEFHSKAKTFLIEGYEVIDGKACLNAMRMYKERQQTDTDNTKEMFEKYQKTAVELCKDNKDKNKSTFVSLEDVKKQLGEVKKNKKQLKGR